MARTNTNTGGGGGGTISGSATANQVAYGSAANTLTSDSLFTRNVSTLDTAIGKNFQVFGTTTFTGTPPNSLSFKGGYTGSSSATFTVTIDSVHNYSYQISSPIGTVPAAGTPFTATGGITGIFLSLSGTTLSLGNTTGFLNPGNTITAGGFTATISSTNTLLDNTMHWVNSAGGSGTYQFLNNQNLNDGVTLSWTTTHNNILGNSWTTTTHAASGTIFNSNGTLGSNTSGTGIVWSDPTNNLKGAMFAGNGVLGPGSANNVISGIFNTSTNDSALGVFGTVTPGVLGYQMGVSSGSNASLMVVTPTTFVQQTTTEYDLQDNNSNSAIRANFASGKPVVTIGDVSGSYNKSAFTVNDTTQTASLVANNFTFGTAPGVFQTDLIHAGGLGGNQEVTIGDVNRVNGGVAFKVSNPLDSITGYANYNTIANSNFLKLDFLNGTMGIGDLSTSKNGTKQIIDDTNKTTTLSSNIFHAQAIDNSSSTGGSSINIETGLVGAFNGANLKYVNGTETAYHVAGSLGGFTISASMGYFNSSNNTLNEFNTDAGGFHIRAGVVGSQIGMDFESGIFNIFTDPFGDIYTLPNVAPAPGQVFTSIDGFNSGWTTPSYLVGTLSVKAASTTALPAYTYTSLGGVGDFITANSNGSINPQDGVTLANGDRILVKDETGGNLPYNGVYVVTDIGSVSTPFVLTRATDADTAPQFSNMTVIPAQGSQAAQPFGQQNVVVTVGTDPILFIAQTSALVQQTTGTQVANQIPFYTSTTNPPTLSKGVSSFKYNPVNNLLDIGGIIQSADMHNNAISFGNATVQEVRSGTYTPVGTNVTNIVSITPGISQWMRVGNVVTVSGVLTLQTVGAGYSEYSLTLPINSTYSYQSQVGGMGWGSSDTYGTYITMTTSNQAEFICFNSGAGVEYVSYQFTYLII